MILRCTNEKFIRVKRVFQKSRRLLHPSADIRDFMDPNSGGIDPEQAAANEQNQADILANAANPQPTECNQDMVDNGFCDQSQLGTMMGRK